MRQPDPAVAPSYDTHFFAWTRHQAALLRTLKGMATELPAGLDLDLVAEELECAGRMELNKVRSRLRRFLISLIRAASAPDHPANLHWKADALEQHFGMLDHYDPSMVDALDMEKVWRSAREIAALQETADGLSGSNTVPGECPFSIHAVVEEDFDLEAAHEMLRGRIKGAAGASSTAQA